MQRFSKNSNNLERLILTSKMTRMFSCRTSKRPSRPSMKKYLFDLNLKIKSTKFMVFIVNYQSSIKNSMMICKSKRSNIAFLKKKWQN